MTTQSSSSEAPPDGEQERKARRPRVVSFALGAWDVTLQVLRNYRDDHAGMRAAAIAYYGLLSFFPILALSLVGATLLLREPGRAKVVALSLRVYVPFVEEAFWIQAVDVAQKRLEALIANRGTLALVGAAVLLFVASRVWVSMERALHVIFRTPKALRLPLLRALIGSLRGIGMTLAVMVALFLWLLVRSILRGIDAMAPRLPEWFVTVLHELTPTRVILPSLIIGFIVYLVFRSVPQASVRHRSALLGAVLFVAGHEVMLFVYGNFVLSMTRASLAYGSFIGLVSIVVWVYWQAGLLLLCAEAASVVNGNRDEPGEEVDDE